jgi:hypothetical protein
LGGGAPSSSEPVRSTTGAEAEGLEGEGLGEGLEGERCAKNEPGAGGGSSDERHTSQLRAAGGLRKVQKGQATRDMGGDADAGEEPGGRSRARGRGSRRMGRRSEEGEAGVTERKERRVVGHGRVSE